MWETSGFHEHSSCPNNTQGSQNTSSFSLLFMNCWRKSCRTFRQQASVLYYLKIQNFYLENRRCDTNMVSHAVEQLAGTMKKERVVRNCGLRWAVPAFPRFCTKFAFPRARVSKKPEARERGNACITRNAISGCYQTEPTKGSKMKTGVKPYSWPLVHMNL